MHILILTYSLCSGGTERVTVNLANHWAKQGRKITIVTLASGNLDFYHVHPLVQRIEIDTSAESSHFIAGIVNNLKRLIALRRILRDTRPDIALGMLCMANILLYASAAGLRDVAIIGSEHGYPPMLPLRHTWRWLRRRTYPLIDQVTMLTREGLDWLEREIPKAQGAVMPNPIVYPLPTTAPMLAPEAWITPNRKLLLAVGRLSAEKGFDRLLHVFAQLAPVNPDWDLIILGEGALRSHLERQVQALGLTDRVYLPGLVGNAGEALLTRYSYYIISLIAKTVGERQCTVAQDATAKIGSKAVRSKIANATVAKRVTITIRLPKSQTPVLRRSVNWP